tara:strand:+ start:199 stop:585 length:387 start_codon:yes stop_codon:yes gene_type:complete
MIPSSEKRTLSVDIPHILVDIYNKYPSNIDFSRGDFVFMSENEIFKRNEAKKAENQLRMVDFALMSIGMGDVAVISYDPISKLIYDMPDGGSNGYERDYNARFRINTDVDSIEKSEIEDLYVHGHKFI